MEDKFRAWTDNLFSRTIGFVVRLLVLLAALLSAAFVALVTLAEIIFWPIIPFSPIILIALGVIL